jgi:hypothetical protein
MGYKQIMSWTHAKRAGRDTWKDARNSAVPPGGGGSWSAAFVSMDAASVFICELLRVRAELELIAVNVKAM